MCRPYRMPYVTEQYVAWHCTVTPQELSATELSSRLRAISPLFTSLYDTASKAACMAAGGSASSCKYYCAGADTGAVAATGACDEAAGCKRLCGVPDTPITRFSSIAPLIDFRCAGWAAFGVWLRRAFVLGSNASLMGWLASSRWLVASIFSNLPETPVTRFGSITARPNFCRALLLPLQQLPSILYINSQRVSKCIPQRPGRRWQRPPERL